MDELHLMLRITDVLIRNLIGIAQVYDIKEKRGWTYVDTLVDSIESCGITFHVMSQFHGKENSLLYFRCGHLEQGKKS